MALGFVAIFFNSDKLFIASHFGLSAARVYFSKLPLVVIETHVDNYLPWHLALPFGEAGVD